MGVVLRHCLGRRCVAEAALITRIQLASTSSWLTLGLCDLGRAHHAPLDLRWELQEQLEAHRLQQRTCSRVQCRPDQLSQSPIRVQASIMIDVHR